MGFVSDILKKDVLCCCSTVKGKALHGCVAVNVVMCFPGELVVDILKAISFLKWFAGIVLSLQALDVRIYPIP